VLIEAMAEDWVVDFTEDILDFVDDAWFGGHNDDPMHQHHGTGHNPRPFPTTYEPYGVPLGPHVDPVPIPDAPRYEYGGKPVEIIDEIELPYILRPTEHPAVQGLLKMPKKGKTKKAKAKARPGRRRRAPETEEVKTIRGKFRLCTIDTGGLTDYGISFPNGMSSWASTRIGRLMSLYERWFMHSITVHYVPTCALTESGSGILAFDWDVLDGVPSDRNMLMEYANSVGFDIKAPVSLTMRNRRLADGRWLMPSLFVSPDAEMRLSQAGMIVLALINSTAETPGYLDVEVMITVEIPQISDNMDWTAGSDTQIGFHGVTAVEMTPSPLMVGVSGGVGDEQIESTVALDHDRIFTGIVDEFSTGDIRLFDATGRDLGPGTRVYYRAIDSVLNAVGPVIDAVADVSAYLG
jgi:hypothetical protein